MTSLKRFTVAIAVVLMTVIAAGGISAIQAGSNLDGAVGADSSDIDIRDYLEQIPDLKPGNSIGMSISLNEDDVFQYLKYLAEPISGIEELPEESKLIVNMIIESDSVEDCIEKIIRTMAEVPDGADVDVSVSMTAGLASVLSITGTEDSPVVEIKSSSGVRASMSLTISYNGETSTMNAYLDMPMSSQTKIAMSNEKIPQSMDTSGKYGMKWSVDTPSSDGTKSQSNDVQVESRTSAKIDDGLTADELNSILNGTGASITKKISGSTYITQTTNGETEFHDETTQYTLDFSDPELMKYASEAKAALQEASSFIEFIEALDFDKIPEYADLAQYLQEAGITEEQYNEFVEILKSSDIKGTIKKIVDFTKEADTTSYYLHWDDSVIHGNNEETINRNASSTSGYYGVDIPASEEKSGVDMTLVAGAVAAVLIIIVAVALVMHSKKTS